MQEYIARENIRRFKAKLQTSTDAEQSEMLRRLIAEEEDRLRDIREAKSRA